VAQGYGVYGGTANFGGYWNTSVFSQQSGVLDFAGLQSTLGNLSSQLDALPNTGSVTSNGVGGLSLAGDGVSTLQVFDLGNLNPANITLSNIPAGAHIVINSARSDVVFSGFVGSQDASVSDLTDLAAFRDRLIFNLPAATSVNMNTGVNGLVLGVQATVMGSGHLEGSVIAHSLLRRSSDNGVLEIGYEPFVAYSAAPATPVPEPGTVALMLAGLGLLGATRRPQAA
jgi:choice-of-anchor A domain-containing protein